MIWHQGENVLEFSVPRFTNPAGQPTFDRLAVSDSSRSDVLSHVSDALTEPVARFDRVLDEVAVFVPPRTAVRSPAACPPIGHTPPGS